MERCEVLEGGECGLGFRGGAGGEAGVVEEAEALEFGDEWCWEGVDLDGEILEVWEASGEFVGERDQHSVGRTLICWLAIEDGEVFDVGHQEQGFAYLLDLLVTCHDVGVGGRFCGALRDFYSPKHFAQSTDYLLWVDVVEYQADRYDVPKVDSVDLTQPSKQILLAVKDERLFEDEGLSLVGNLSITS